MSEAINRLGDAKNFVSLGYTHSALMAIDDAIKILQAAQAQAGDWEATIQRLRGQLQNCVNHIERLKRHHPRETEKLEACVQAANKCLYETLHDTRPQPAVNQQLPEAIELPEHWSSWDSGFTEGWNACREAAIAAAQGK